MGGCEEKISRKEWTAQYDTPDNEMATDLMSSFQAVAEKRKTTIMMKYSTGLYLCCE